MTRSAIYLRISSDPNQRRIGVEDQRRQCETLCTDQGWQVVGVYEDNDRSAAKRHAERPDYERMVAEIRAGRVDVVVVAAVDRLQRHPGALEEFIETSTGAGMGTLASWREGIFDLADPTALRRLRDSVNLASWEVGRMRQRMLRRRVDMARRGVPAGGGKRAFGWMRDKDDPNVPEGMIVNETEAALIREAAERVLRGDTLRAIRDDWQRRGIPTVTGAAWTTNSVKAILRNARNAGLRRHQGAVIGEAAWPAIINRPTWERLQTIFNDPSRQPRTPRSTSRPYPLRGVLQCGNCGRPLIAVPRKKPTDNDPERRRRYYGCRRDPGPKGAQGCGKIFVDAEHVEKAVFGHVIPLVDDPHVRALAAGEQKAEHDEIETLLVSNAEDAATRNELAADHYQHRVIDRGTFLQQDAALRHRIEERQSRIASLRGHSALDRFDGPIADHWAELTADEQRTITLSLVRYVTVLPAGRGGFNRFRPTRLDIRWRWDELARRAQEWEKHATPEDRAEAARLAAGPLLTEEGEDTGLDLVIKPAPDAEVIPLQKGGKVKA